MTILKDRRMSWYFTHGKMYLYVGLSALDALLPGEKLSQQGGFERRCPSFQEWAVNEGNVQSSRLSPALSMLYSETPAAGHDGVRLRLIACYTHSF